MDSSVTGLNELTDLADDDLHYVVDVSDTSGGANGTGKKAQQSNIVKKLDALRLRITADGSITAAQAVEFLEGKAKQGGGDNMTQASEVTASTNNGNTISACVLSETSFAVAFIASGGTLQCIVGTISGTTITYGTEVQVDAATTCLWCSIFALSSTKIGIAYRTNTDGWAILATVSDTVPTFGSAVSFDTGNNNEAINAIALSSSLFAVSYNESAGTTGVKMVAATVSGTTPTFGSTLTVNGTAGAAASMTNIVKMSSTTIVGFANIGSGTGIAYYFIVTYSSSTLTLVNIFYSQRSAGDYLSRVLVRLNSNTLIHVFRGWDTYGYARLVTLIGPELRISGNHKITSAVVSDTAPAVEAVDENRACAIFNVGSTGVMYLLEIQNETIVVKNSVVVSSTADALAPRVLAVKPDKVVAVYNRSSNVKSRLCQVSKFLGIAATSAADTAEVQVYIRGVSAGHSSLTPGALYYTDATGVISTDSSGHFLGFAISATQILLSFALDRATASRSDLIDSIPVAYTPTFTGFGTVSGVNAKSWRIGSELFFEITFTCGTTTAVEARVSLGYKGVNSAVTSAANYPTLQAVGDVVRGVAATYIVYALIEVSKQYVTFGYANLSSSNPLAKVNASTIFNAGEVLSLKGSVRITGW